MAPTWAAGLPSDEITSRRALCAEPGVAADRHGPMGPGTIREYKQVIFSTDPVAIDAYGAELFGMKAADIGHVAIAAELGLGTIDWKKLNPVRV